MRFARHTINRRINIRRRLFKYRNNQKQNNIPHNSIKSNSNKNYRILLTIN